ncbi:MAG: copper chaperone PCu(A)C [Paracoccaceae bacterium]
MRLFAIAAALAATATLGLVPATAAHEFEKNGVVVEHPWARPTIPNRPTAAYFVLSNTGAATDTLIEARAPAFDRVELHITRSESGVMNMARVESVMLEPGDEVAFEPGSYHVMLFDAAEPLAEGDRFPMTLVFEQAGEIEVEVVVERQGSGGGSGSMEMDHGDGS